MNLRLAQNMTKELVSVSENCRVEEALMIMKNHQFRHLPVVNEQKAIIGFVSERDLYKNLNTNDIAVREFMAKTIYKFDVKTNMKVIAEAMLKQKISAFLVTQNEQIIGIITTDDMLQLLTQLLDVNTETAEPSLLEDFLMAASDLSKAVRNPNIVT